MYSEISILWLDKSENVEKVKKRNIDVEDCIGNAKHIKSFTLDKVNFQKKVKEALGGK
ncbi:MAG: hypothetical protein NUV32_09000 [Exilispira sp.]|nr:hypothetical protein [Exilispira sp.]